MFSSVNTNLTSLRTVIHRNTEKNKTVMLLRSDPSA